MLRLQDIMSTDLKSIGPNEPAERAFTCMKQWSVHHLLVIEKGVVLGVITDHDLGGRAGSTMRRDRVVEDLMIAKPLCADASMTVRQAAKRMRHRSIGCLPVTRSGKVVGIITVSDLLDVIGRGVETHVVRAERKPLTRKSLSMRT